MSLKLRDCTREEFDAFIRAYTWIGALTVAAYKPATPPGWIYFDPRRSTKPFDITETLVAVWNPSERGGSFRIPVERYSVIAWLLADPDSPDRVPDFLWKQIGIDKFFNSGD